MTKAAWEALDEFTRTGKITFPGQDQPHVPDKTLVDTFKWFVQFAGKPRKTPKAMDDWRPQETR